MEERMIPGAETVESLQREVILRDVRIRNANEIAIMLNKENKDLGALVSQKNAQIIKLEAENVRLKMVRTDAELAVQVDGLRKEVGTKDRRLVEVERAVTTMRESEALALRRASEAEQKVRILQATIETMQTARDESERRASASMDAVRESERLTAIEIAKAKAAKEEARVATKPYENLLRLAEAVVLKSLSLNRNETEAKSFRTALELHRKSKGNATG
jgi:hypothetical protein